MLFPRAYNWTFRTSIELTRRHLKPRTPVFDLAHLLRTHFNPKRAMATAMGKRLEGKTIVVTGASSGIGRSTAMEFARTSSKNLKLVLTARRVEKLEQIAEEIKKEVGEGVQVLPVKLDVSDSAEVKGFVESLPVEFREVDVLVNNACVKP